MRAGTGCSILALNPGTKKALSQPTSSELPWAQGQVHIWAQDKAKDEPQMVDCGLCFFSEGQIPLPYMWEEFWVNLGGILFSIIHKVQFSFTIKSKKLSSLEDEKFWRWMVVWLHKVNVLNAT